MNIKKTFFAPFAYVALGAAPLFGQSFTATHDAYIQGSTADTNYGAAEFVNATSISSRKSYIQFDVSSITGIVDSATLSFDVRTRSSNIHNFNVYGLNDGVTGEAWDESTLTFNNAPGNDSGFSGVVAEDVTLLDNFDVSSALFDVGDTVTLSSANIASYLNNDTNGIVSFLIIRQNSQNAATSFYSKENLAGAIAPTLTVTTAVPEPSTYALIGGMLSLCYLVWRRRAQ